MSDVKLADNVADLNPYTLYSDMPIFNVPEDKLSPQMLVRQDNMRRLIDEQLALDNELIFPSEDMRLVAVF